MLHASFHAQKYLGINRIGFSLCTVRIVRVRLFGDNLDAVAQSSALCELTHRKVRLVEDGASHLMEDFPCRSGGGDGGSVVLVCIKRIYVKSLASS